MPEIIILACVALFVGLRLYAVLGRRTGHEQPPVAKPESAGRSPIVARPAADRPTGRSIAEGAAATAAIDPAAVDGVRAIVSADPHFDVAGFLDGARSAYRQTLEAFWAGDDATLARLASPEVADAFSAAIAARREAGETLENRLVDIEHAAIDAAALSGRTALVTVRFDADIAAVTRDADGNVVAGSLTDAIQTHDLWTFSRDTRATDPNWTLIETDEVE